MAHRSPTRLRILNDQAALKSILVAGQVSRADLEQLTRLSKPATADLLARLEEAGLVMKCGMRDGGPGPKAQLWKIRPEVGYAAGVKVAPTGVRVTVSDLVGEKSSTVERAWAGEATPTQVAQCLDDACLQLGLNRDQISHAVVSVPGSLDLRTGALKYAPQLPSWEGLQIGSLLQKELGITTEVENDVNLMALSEMEGGWAGETNNFAFVWIDEGLGAATVLQSELYRGPTGAAGEIAYVRIPSASSGGECNLGVKLGDVLTSAGISQLAHKYGLTGEDPLVALQSAVAGEAGGQELLSELANAIALGMTAIITVLDPELILLGGKFGAEGGQVLVDLVKDRLAILLPAPPDSIARIISCPVTDDAALSGALQVALRRSQDKAFKTGSVVVT